VDDRRVINGMLFKAKTGVAWRDLPERTTAPFTDGVQAAAERPHDPGRAAAPLTGRRGGGTPSPHWPNTEHRRGHSARLAWSERVPLIGCDKPA
jgi:transposase